MWSFTVISSVKLCSISVIFHVSGTKNFTANVIYGFGYKSESDWYAWYNTTSHCVQKLTGICQYIRNIFPTRQILDLTWSHRFYLYQFRSYCTNFVLIFVTWGTLSRQLLLQIKTRFLNSLPCKVAIWVTLHARTDMRTRGWSEVPSRQLWPPMRRRESREFQTTWNMLWVGVSMCLCGRRYLRPHMSVEASTLLIATHSNSLDQLFHLILLLSNPLQFILIAVTHSIDRTDSN